VTLKNNEMTDEMEKIKVKVMDFNVFDVFKNQTDEDGNPKQFDPQIILIENLENKMNTKFGLVETKVKNIEKLVDSKIHYLEINQKDNDTNIKKLQDKNFKIEKIIKSIGEQINKIKGGTDDIKFDLGDEEGPIYARMDEVKQYVENRINE